MQGEIKVVISSKAERVERLVYACGGRLPDGFHESMKSLHYRVELGSISSSLDRLQSGARLKLLGPLPIGTSASLVCAPTPH